MCLHCDACFVQLLLWLVQVHSNIQLLVHLQFLDGSEMEINQPLVRIIFEKHAAQLNIDGWLFHLHSASGQSEIADVLPKQKAPQLVYQAWPDFVNKFSATLPLWSADKWDHKAGLSAWQDSVIYHSFLLHSEQGKCPHIYEFWFIFRLLGIQFVVIDKGNVVID